MCVSMRMCLCMSGGVVNVGAYGAGDVRSPGAEVTLCSESPHVGTGAQTPVLCMTVNTLTHWDISPVPLSIFLNMYGKVHKFVKICFEGTTNIFSLQRS